MNTDTEVLAKAQKASRQLAAVTKHFSSIRPFICGECGAQVPGSMSDISAAADHVKWHRSQRRAASRLVRAIST